MVKHLGLGGDCILQISGGPCDLAGIYVKEYSTPTALRDQLNVYSHRAMTYVLAAPDFNRSAGSSGRSAGVGFSRTLEGTSQACGDELGIYRRTISNTGGTPWNPLGQAPRRQDRCRTHPQVEEAALFVP
jgi:hypothetical protein